MGNSCCTVAQKEANDDTVYRPDQQAIIIGKFNPQEIEQPWKEKIKTKEGKFSAVDPKFKVVHIPGLTQLRRFEGSKNLELI